MHHSQAYERLYRLVYRVVKEEYSDNTGSWGIDETLRTEEDLIDRKKLHEVWIGEKSGQSLLTNWNRLSIMNE